VPNSGLDQGNAGKKGGKTDDIPNIHYPLGTERKGEEKKKDCGTELSADAVAI